MFRAQTIRTAGRARGSSALGREELRKNAAANRKLKIQKRKKFILRKEWDSNPRYPLRYTRFRGERLQPLGHPSIRSHWQSQMLAKVRGEILLSSPDHPPSEGGNFIFGPL